VFETSKRSRRKWVRSLLSRGELSSDEAAQIAWAASPFNDNVVPKSRDFERSVLAMSWQFLRESKGIGLNDWHGTALSYLRRMAEVARHQGEPYYSALYSDLVDGEVPAEQYSLFNPRLRLRGVGSRREEAA
jgi:hypothetical protein